MVYFVSSNYVYDDPIYPRLLDAPEKGAFDGVTYEQVPDLSDLNAIERELLAKGQSAMEHGFRVFGNTAPKKMLWAGGNRPLLDVILNNCLAVSPSFRDLVEKFEPGVHQFFPVDIYKSKNGPPVSTYYWLNVCNRLESINEDKTTFSRRKDYTGKYFWTPLNVEYPKLVFSKSKISNLHLWVDPCISTMRYFYVSNEFGEAAIAQNFLGLSLKKYEDA